MKKWIVWDYDGGLQIITNNYDEALKVYESCKQNCINYVSKQREFDGDENIILAEIDKNFYSRFVKFNSDKDEIWEFAEDTNDYNTKLGKSNIFGFKK